MKSRHAARPMMAVAVCVLAIALTAVLCGCSEGGEVSTTEETAPAEAVESGSIAVGGLVDYPMTLTVLDLDYMDWIVGEVDHPDLGAAEYQGAPFSQVFSYVGVQPEARRVTITSSSGASVDIALDEIAGDDAILAVADDGALNMVMPGLEEEAWVIDVIAMEFK